MGEVITGFGTQVGLCYWDGSAWQKLTSGKIAGFESIIGEEKSSANLAEGNNTFSGTAVGTGKVWKVTAASFYYLGTAPTRMVMSACGLAGTIILKAIYSVTSARWYTWTGEVYLEADDYMQLLIVGATAGDEANLRYAGVQIDAP